MSVFKKTFVGLLLSFAFSSFALAQTSDPVATLISQIVKDLNFMYESGVHSADQARIYVLKKSTEEALSRYLAKPIHRQTEYAIFNMYSRFKVSGPFFQFIQTDFNQSTIQDIYSSFDGLRDELGLDDSPYNKVVAVNLKQILEQVQILSRNPKISQSLRNHLNALLSPLGDALSLADNGDSTSTYQEARKIYALIKDLYKDLEMELVPQQDLFVAYMEIVGVNEFLSAFTAPSR